MSTRDREIEYLLLSRPYPLNLENLAKQRDLGERAVDYLLQMAEDPSAERRSRAAWRVAELRAPGAADVLVRITQRDDDALVRGAARTALCMLGEPALPFALSLLGSADPEDRKHGALMLHDIAHPDSIPPLIRATRDPDRQVRGEAAIALGAIGGADALDAILAASHDVAPVIRDYAVNALAEIGGDVALQRLREMLDDPAEGVCNEALFHLGVPPDEQAGEDPNAPEADSVSPT